MDKIEPILDFRGSVALREFADTIWLLPPLSPDCVSNGGIPVGQITVFVAKGRVRND